MEAAEEVNQKESEEVAREKLGFVYNSKVSLTNFLMCNWYKKYEHMTVPTLRVNIPEDYVIEICGGSNEDLGGVKDESSDESDEWSVDKFFNDNDGLPPGVDEIDDEKPGSDNHEGELREKTKEEVETDHEPFFIEINKGIRRLGGSAVQKVLWKVPTDAAGILTTGIKCSSADDVDILMRFSPRTCDVLKQTYQDWKKHDEKEKHKNAGTSGPVLHLYLRKWFNFQDSDVFRVFIAHGRLVAICQRDLSVSYGIILADRHNIVLDVYELYLHKIIGYDKSLDDFSSCCMDIIRFAQGKLLLLDFNACTDETVLPYFSFQDLLEIYTNMLDDSGEPSASADVPPSSESSEMAVKISYTNDPLPARVVTDEIQKIELYKILSPEKYLPRYPNLGNPCLKYSVQNMYNV